MGRAVMVLMTASAEVPGQLCSFVCYGLCIFGESGLRKWGIVLCQKHIEFAQKNPGKSADSQSLFFPGCYFARFAQPAAPLLTAASMAS